MWKNVSFWLSQSEENFPRSSVEIAEVPEKKVVTMSVWKIVSVGKVFFFEKIVSILGLLLKIH